MLSEFDIINMNGRLYDPVLGRFFSPDNYVQMPDNSQNFNRYSYCLNNPLKYADPSGDVFVLDDFIAITAMGAMMGVMNAAMSDKPICGIKFLLILRRKIWWLKAWQLMIVVRGKLR